MGSGRASLSNDMTGSQKTAETIQGVAGHAGPIARQTTVPGGFPEKTMDVSRLRGLGWRHRVGLEKGPKDAYT